MCALGGARTKKHKLIALSPKPPCDDDQIQQEPTCVVVKHTNPCGVASAGAEGGGLLEAYRAAVRADPISAFGGIVAFNVPVDAALAREIREFR